MKPKNQHWVPQFYLRHFATPESADTAEPQVWIFSKHQDDPQLTNVKNVATKRYLYSPKREDGTRNWEVDEKLERLESLLSRIWPSLATRFVDLHGNESIRKVVALFISTLYLRHPARLLDVANIHARLVATCEQLPKDENGNPLIVEIEYQGSIHPFDNSGYREYKNAGPDEMQKMFVDNLNRPTLKGKCFTPKISWRVSLRKSLGVKRWLTAFACPSPNVKP